MRFFSPAVQLHLARLLANLLLVGLVCYLASVAAQLSWAMLWQEKSLSVPQGRPAAESEQAPSASSVAGYTFFGSSDKTLSVAPAIRRSAPETGLRLTLEGVLVGARPEDSGAIVAQNSGDTAYYRVGDRLPGNAELAEVDVHRILLRRAGQYESLSFEDAVDARELVPETSKASAQSPDQLLANARQQLDTEGVAALERFGLSPAGEDGVSGYRYDGSNALLNAVNLRAGDVITAINGQRLGNLEQDKTLLEDWRNQSRLDIELERNGSVFTVSYAIPEQWR
ncbi:MAG: general secretion pathway protein GspC [Alteromonadaceae bacterium]|nr:general secretion pathway protein GspC [Alteromonadaceae bacterium]